MVTRYWQLDAYKLAKEGRLRIFQLSKKFPKEEMYSLTDQIRKSSRSVCSHIAEAWGRRPYRADFINKLNMAESEALETQSWLNKTCIGVMGEWSNGVKRKTPTPQPTNTPTPVFCC